MKKFSPFISAVILSGVLLTTQSGYSQNPRRVLAQYDFNIIRHDTVFDISGNGRNGKIFGATTHIVRGVEGKALKFDNPGDYVLVLQPDGGICASNEVTMEAWVTFEDRNPQSFDFYNIVGIWGRDSLRSFNFYLCKDIIYNCFLGVNGPNGWGFGVGGTNGHTEIGFGPNSRPNQRWKYIVATYAYDPGTNRSRMKLYNDAVLSSDWSDRIMVCPLLRVNEPLRIGGVDYCNPATAWTFTGAVDQIRISNYALTQSEIQNRFHQIPDSSMDKFPVINLTATPSTLAPSDSRMVTVNLNSTCSQNCAGNITGQIVEVTCSEPVTNGWNITGSMQLQLKAQPSSTPGLNRVYRIKVRSFDEVRNMSYDYVTVSVPPAVPIIESFESTSNFIISQGSMVLNTTYKTEGAASIEMKGNYYQQITTKEMSTAGFTNLTNKLAIDLYIGNNQPNQWWIGDCAMYISCPSAAIYNVYLANIPLTGLPQNQFNTITFTLPQYIVDAFRQYHPDASFSFALNTNAGSGPYYVDNLRFVQ
jgi:hypothetical protein